MNLRRKLRAMFNNNPVYNPSDLNPEVIKLISLYEDLVGTQNELFALKLVTKDQSKHLKIHLMNEQKTLIQEIEEIRENLLPLHF